MMSSLRLTKLGGDRGSGSGDHGGDEGSSMPNSSTFPSLVDGVGSGTMCTSHLRPRSHSRSASPSCIHMPGSRVFRGLTVRAGVNPSSSNPT